MCSTQGNIKSSGFYVAGISSIVYFADTPINEEKGIIYLFTTTDGTTRQVIRRNVGEIDYIKGEIIIYPINIRDTVKKYGFDNIIQISTTPRSNDIIALQDLYLQLDVSNSRINMVVDNISSGSDISGSNYISTSSYSDDKIIRT